MPAADIGISHDRETGCQDSAALGQQLRKTITFQCGGFALETQENDALPNLTLEEGQFTEVLVIGQQHPAIPIGQRDDISVRYAGGQLRHEQHIVALPRARTRQHGLPDSRRPAASPCRLGELQNLISGQRICGIRQCGGDISLGQPRVIPENLGHRYLGGHLAKNQFHRNPRAANHRLANHHGGIDLNARMFHAEQNTASAHATQAASQ